MIKIAIEPKSKGDLEKMSNGLIKLAQEDPSFNFSRDEETNQTVIEGMGELHLDIIVDRLRREFKVRCWGRCLPGSGERQAHSWAWAASARCNRDGAKLAAAECKELCSRHRVIYLLASPMFCYM